MILLVLASASTAGLAWTLRRNAMLRRCHDRALHLASHDRLTGLRTRVELLADLIRLHAAGRPIVLAIVNVDQFSQINRRFGYRCGDQLLTCSPASPTTTPRPTAAPRTASAATRWPCSDPTVRPPTATRSPRTCSPPSTGRLRWPCPSTASTSA
jgi:hypothetical protein